ncbi:MAG: hypothetical protein GY858_04915 [Candidatus Omnitrophica bacterium]|nr:hypothetical protein [Candidatus Omnitrophota bacterium]
MKRDIKQKIIGLFLISTLITGCVPSNPAEKVEQPLETNNLLFTSEKVSSPVLKGIKINPDDPFRLEFIIDPKDKTNLSKNEFNRLVSYFMAALALPEKDFWVNLSPLEENRVINAQLAQTDFGGDLLMQDYVLKQLSASLTFPDSALGKKYWEKVHAKLHEATKTANAPVSTFNKVWIAPRNAEIYETGNIAIITEANLQVFLEKDYLASKNKRNTDSDTIAEQITKEIIIPEIEEDVNGGENFAQLRQMFHSFLLANWFKGKLKDSVYNHYIDQGKVSGISLDDPTIKEKIYAKYLQAYKNGAYNYIRKEFNPHLNRTQRKHYLSGGVGLEGYPKYASVRPLPPANEATTEGEKHSRRDFFRKIKKGSKVLGGIAVCAIPGAGLLSGCHYDDPQMVEVITAYAQEAAELDSQLQDLALERGITKGFDQHDQYDYFLEAIIMTGISLDEALAIYQAVGQEMDAANISYMHEPGEEELYRYYDFYNQAIIAGEAIRRGQRARDFHQVAIYETPIKESPIRKLITAYKHTTDNLHLRSPGQNSKAFGMITLLTLGTGMNVNDLLESYPLLRKDPVHYSYMLLIAKNQADRGEAIEDIYSSIGKLTAERGLTPANGEIANLFPIILRNVWSTKWAVDFYEGIHDHIRQGEIRQGIDSAYHGEEALLARLACEMYMKNVLDGPVPVAKAVGNPVVAAVAATTVGTLLNKPSASSDDSDSSSQSPQEERSGGIDLETNTKVINQGEKIHLNISQEMFNTLKDAETLKVYPFHFGYPVDIEQWLD